MGHLGSFGAALRELDPNGDKDTFDFFGQEFVIEGVMPAILRFRLAAAIVGGESGTAGLAAMWESLRHALTRPAGDDRAEDGSQFDRFVRLAVAHRCDTDSLMDLTFKLFEAQTGRPTEEPRGSSAGSSTTSPKPSTSSSAHPALAHLRPVEQVLAG